MALYDAVVVGSGPNGLAAAITLAREGLSVLLREANETVGGGARSAELTLPGFVHDLCSAVHPLAVCSPFFQQLPLADYGLEWIQPPLPLAHPFDHEGAGAMERSLDNTANQLGTDGDAYRRLWGPIVREWEAVVPEILAPLHWPSYPLSFARFGLKGLQSAGGLARSVFQEAPARALFAGLAAHSVVPLHRLGTASIGLVLGAAAHAAGWPIPRGGAQAIANALASHFSAIGGKIQTQAPVETLDELPAARCILLDLTPRQIVSLARTRLPARFTRKLERYRYGPGVFKLDWALAEPIPWRSSECRKAGTVHIGGTLEEIEAAERAPWEGQDPERPFVLLAQPSLFDTSRAPAGKHTAWAYCHVPHGSVRNLTSAVEEQVERFAPGFRDLVLARHAMTTADLERRNKNLVGGDISGGANDLWQLLFRPVPSFDPYRTPLDDLYICSSSTPPGGGVHGMCGFHAAQSALRHTFGK